MDYVVRYQGGCDDKERTRVKRVCGPVGSTANDGSEGKPHDYKVYGLVRHIEKQVQGAHIASTLRYILTERRFQQSLVGLLPCF